MSLGTFQLDTGAPQWALFFMAKEAIVSNANRRQEAWDEGRGCQTTAANY